MILMWPGDLAGQDEDARDAILGGAEVERAELADHLRLAWENGDEDPLLSCLAGARERMLAAERDLRLLLAYGREFASPRPYRLEDLARASAMSISGIRTAYDDDEVEEIAKITGLEPRPRKANQ